MRHEIVGDNVDRTVRYHGCRGGSGDHQRDERTKGDGHCCAHSGALRRSPSAKAFSCDVTYNATMNDRAKGMRAFLRGVARLQRTFTIEIGPLRATGVPAILIGVTGIVLAGGVTAALAKGATRLPEALGEARGLAEALNSGGSPRLRS